jgi:hypothetical protein
MTTTNKTNTSKKTTTTSTNKANTSKTKKRTYGSILAFLADADDDMNPFEALAQGLMDGTLKPNGDVTDRGIPYGKKFGGNKPIEEEYPFFKTTYGDMSTFAKIKLLGEYADIPMEEIEEFKLTDIDRYMLSFMDIDVGEVPVIELRHNMPEGLSADDKIVAKKILKRKMTNEERGVYDHMVKAVREARHKFLVLETEIYPYLQLMEDSNKDEYLKSIDADTKHNMYLTVDKARRTGWFDMPEVTSDEDFYVNEYDPDPADDGETVIVDMDFINGLADGIGEELSNAGYDISNVSKLLGKSFAPTRKILSNSIIDMGLGFIRSYIALHPDKVQNLIKKIPCKFAIDTSIDVASNIGKLLKAIIDSINDLRDAESEDEQIQVIDDLADELKTFDVLDDPDVVKLLNSIIEKNKKSDSKKDKKVDVKEMLAAVADAVKEDTDNDSQEDEKPQEAEQEDVVNAAMDSNVAATALHNIKDDEKPSFLNAIIDTFKKDKGEKPDFILDANKATVPQQPVQQVQVVHVIHEDLLKANPWVAPILEIASKHGVTCRIDPIYGVTTNQQVLGLQFSSFVNNKFMHQKSFVIDLGYVLDKRVKMFASAKQSGFDYVENCSEAYHVFNANTNALQSMLFDKIFSGGFDSLNEEDRKKYRMYNNATMQLNRIINYWSLPTNLVRGDERSALKDSAFKMFGCIKEMNKRNHINLGRFTVIDFDKENLTYTLTNEGTFIIGNQKNTAPITKFVVTINKDSDGKIKKDEDGKPIISFTAIFAENVFANGFILPDGSVIDPITTDNSAVEDVVINLTNPTDDGEKPAFTQQ